MRGRITQRSLGSWTIVYDLPRGLDGKRKQKRVTLRGTKKEAEKELRRRLQEIDDGLIVDAAKGTLRDHLERWLETIRATIAPKTFEGYQIVVRTHLLPHLGHRRLETLKPADIQDFILMLQRSGSRTKGHEGQSLAGITVHHIGSVLRQALALAVDMGVLARNPAARVKLPAPVSPEKRALNEEQIAQVMTATEKSYLHMLILLGAAIGARRGELLALRWQDVDLESGKVTICRSLEETTGGLRFKEPKTRAGRRTVVLPSYALRALIRHKGQQSELRLQLGPAWHDLDLIICHPDGSAIRSSTASVRMKQAMDRIGMAGATLHGLRHSFASLAIHHGANLKTLQTVLGHANINVTLGRYGHMLGGEQEKVAERINEAMAKVVGL
jgi:integrase